MTPAGLGGSRRRDRAVAGVPSSFPFCRLILGWPVFILFLFIPLLEWGVIFDGVRAHGALGVSVSCVGDDREVGLAPLLIAF